MRVRHRHVPHSTRTEPLVNRMRARHSLAMLPLLVMAAAAPPVGADPALDKAAITERLRHWTAAFNAHDKAGICDLFAPDLVYTIPGALDGNRAGLCANIHAVQSRPGLHLHYDDPDIREIIVSGDIAVVRLFWTLTARKGAERDVTTEAGMDVFRRQPDGNWSIIRFLSFTITPNKNLQ